MCFLHLRYRIDGKLVAVGVIDIMQSCVSSKYFFWDPDYSFLELGKISSLAEIDFVNQARRIQATLHYYYQGYVDSLNLYSDHNLSLSLSLTIASLEKPNIREIEWRNRPSDPDRDRKFSFPLRYSKELDEFVNTWNKYFDRQRRKSNARNQNIVIKTQN